MKDLYICTGQYHLFCSILLKLIDNRDCDGDLVICDCFEDADVIYNRIVDICSYLGDKIRMFDKIILLDKQRYKKLDLARLSTSIKIIKSITNRFTKPQNTLLNVIDSSYSRIYIAGAVPAIVEYCLYEKKKYGSEIILFDDGMGSRIHRQEPSIRHKIFDYSRTIPFFKSVSSQCFFSPNLVCDVYPHVRTISQCKPKRYQVEEHAVDYDVLNYLINHIFNYNDRRNPLNDHDIIYFSAGLDLCDWLSKYSSWECTMINAIGKRYKRFAVKKHPNSNEEYTQDIPILKNICIPEVLYLNTDIEDKLLISSGSAAIFNPSFIFDKNPYLILTYKMFDKYGNFVEDLFRCSSDELKDKIQKTLIAAYNNPDKIYLPSSMEELMLAIDDYMTKTKK